MLKSPYVTVRYTKVPFVISVSSKTDNYVLLRHTLPEHINVRDIDDLVFALRRIYVNYNVTSFPLVPF